MKKLTKHRTPQEALEYVQAREYLASNNDADARHKTKTGTFIYEIKKLFI